MQNQHQGAKSTAVSWTAHTYLLGVFLAQVQACAKLLNAEQLLADTSNCLLRLAYAGTDCLGSTPVLESEDRD